MSEKIWTKAANTMVAAGPVPMPVTETLLELLRTIMDEDEADFIRIFTKPSLNMEEIKASSGMDDASLRSMLDGLLHKGAVMVTTSRSTGVEIYTLMPPFPGLFEMTMVRGETGEKEKKLAVLFEELFEELTQLIQANYDNVMEAFKTIPPITRVVPVECEVDMKLDGVMPYEDAGRIVDKFDTFAVSHCYCRHHKNLLGKACEATEEKVNCLTFGRSAKFMIDYGFGKEITAEETKRILAECEEAGLVHKFFHEKNNLERDEFAICNCCKCCCGTFELYYRGAAPMQTYTSHRAAVDAELCNACGVCVDMCPMEAVELVEDTVRIDDGKCIGCGVCAYHCASEAVALERTGIREVFVPPPRIA
ncbi:MAG: 4Fe-4S binding protein [Actinomycetota bacterium]|nr:4Fe-4S binding protein [Actinomycetota bacterium]MDD5667611.1 4Fe-4S binding protein [Actinomycetota bacterium]